MSNRIVKILINKFLGNTNLFYKYIIILFMIINPILFFFNSFISGWILIIEFIFILIMSSYCYPLAPGGIISVQAIIIGMANTEQIKQQIFINQEILFILIFMVPGINFIKKFLLFIFTKITFNFNSKICLSLTYFIISAVLSAFLDAMTVIIIIITITKEIYDVYYYNFFILKKNTPLKEIKNFKAFLCSLVMQASIGSVIGGTTTMIGEPQNIIIANSLGWNFFHFFQKMYPITMPVMIFAIITSIFIEKFKLFGYGYVLPNKTKKFFLKNEKNFFDTEIFIQFLIFLWIILAITLQLAEISLIGLSVIILSTTFCGIKDEYSIGKEFAKILPFVTLLIIFFVIVVIIDKQKLFLPIINYILKSEKNLQIVYLYLFNGLLSSISDNVFIGSIFINEIKNHFLNNLIDFKKFEELAITVNIGTNFLSIVTPNGQASLLFLLTSHVAKLINLSYKKILIMTFPFTVVISITGLLFILINNN